VGVINPIPILLYHSVSWQSSAAGRFTVTPEQFTSHLAAILDSERVPVTIGEVAAALRGDRPLPPRAIGITFDDAYADTAEAIEFLCGHRLRATVYVTTGQIGNPEMIHHDDLLRLAALAPAVELGAHTVTHPYLDELSGIDVAREVTDSKARLEHLLGREITTFAYPHGAFDGRARAAVIAAGYSSAAAVKNALSHSGDDPWGIARWTVRRDTSADQIARILAGNGAPHAWRGERTRTRIYRGVRRLCRRVGARA
jgi:peptidoglycan/xylan/chitin deacetylase (PgdA/CDA1 family)